MERTLKELAQMAKVYMAQRGGLKSIDLQLAAALIATYVKRGNGRYEIVDSCSIEEGFKDYYEVLEGPSGSEIKEV